MIVISKLLLAVAVCLAFVGIAGCVGLLLGALGIGRDIDREND